MGRLHLQKRIGLIQVDGIMPNLALMKLSSFYKKKGLDVYFVDLSSLHIDYWLASKIFVGGSGYNLKETLPKEIEEITPDYEGFDTDYSIGFTTRGCNRNCDFCIVRTKEGTPKDVDMNWLRHQKVILLDPNFLQSPTYKEKLQYFIDFKLKVCFLQGLDIRMINEENATQLLKVKSYDRKFRRRAYFFAFDDPNLEAVIKKKVKQLLKLGFKKQWLVFYILIGFDTTPQQDYKRLKIIKQLGCRPFTSIYNNRTDDKWLIEFDRYVNGRWHEFVKFKDYRNGVLIKGLKKHETK